ncbi:MAG: hydroxyacid dehydrogenase [Lentisphaerae bacterium]|nr:hydroxyacid dehydrogenase [Lentisphaerota bacterium]
MYKAALLGDSPEQIERVYGRGQRERLSRLTTLHPDVLTSSTLAAQAATLREVETIFSTWGMPALSADRLACLPALRAVFYAAGSVKAFAAPLLERGITVVSAWAANAVPVAEFALAQILLANKGYHRNRADFRCPADYARAFRGSGNYGGTVALLGAGMVGRALIGLLRHVTLNVIVWDPMLSDADAAALGVRRVPHLAEAFHDAHVVSNHLANVPATRGLLDEALFSAMRPHACFINTGRGATVREDDLIRVLRARPDLTALLDVTEPEPPVEGSPLYDLPNVHLTTHVAGSLNDEVGRMAAWMIDEFQTWRSGQPLRYAVTADMLATMA